MLGSRPDRDPDCQEDGVLVWIDKQKGKLFVIVRQENAKTKTWRLVETHSGPNGGEFRFDPEPE